MDTQVSARAANIILGAWLFISAFLWPHSPQQYTNAWLVGLLVAAIAIVGFWVPSIRYLNTVLAVWLFISAWALPRVNSGTTWNHVLVAIAIFVVSMIPNRPMSRVGGTTGTTPARTSLGSPASAQSS
jgi:hypothetical protein